MKEEHLWPGLTKMYSYEPSRDKIKDHKNFRNDLKQVPDPCWWALNTNEKKGCEEIVALDHEEKLGPQLSEVGFISTFPRIEDLVDWLCPNWVDNFLKHQIVILLFNKKLSINDFTVDCRWPSNFVVGWDLYASVFIGVFILCVLSNCR